MYIGNENNDLRMNTEKHRLFWKPIVNDVLLKSIMQQQHSQILNLIA